jgi:HPt (histidine-containing phosphotransfer) domain-containing protein
MRAFRVPGGPDPVARLIELFLRDAPGRLARIRAALQQNDAQALQDAAHALNGSASTLGVFRMQELCAELEDLAQSGSADGAAEVVQALEAAFERARPELEQLRRAEAAEPH